MRIALVGLGSIAQKAYLPVISGQNDVDLVLCTRNAATLRTLSQRYRVAACVTSVAALIAERVDAAFVHTSTESHVQVASQLLGAGIHVHVDKPIAYSYDECESLVEIAERAGLLLVVGFNRRFAPTYRGLLTADGPRVVVMQKNRTLLPDFARRFVYDDFIHVVDTLRFLRRGEIVDERAHGRVQAGRLHHVVVQLAGPAFTAVGVMNRDSGATEETLELMTPGNKWVVRGLDTTIHSVPGSEHTHRFGEWETVLARRGFPQMVDHFLRCVRGEATASITGRDALETHALCERVVLEMERRGATPWSPGAP